MLIMFIDITYKYLFTLLEIDRYIQTSTFIKFKTFFDIEL